MEKKKVIHIFPLAIRWFHWINFPVISIMVWSGLLIYWANDVYKIGFGDKTLLKFFPDSFYKAFNIPFRLAEGMSYHFVFMWLFAVNGLCYVLYLFISQEYKDIIPQKKSFKEAWLVLLHDLRIRRQKPAQGKFNAAQRVAYSMVILMGAGSLLTGIAIYKPVQFNWLCFILGGYKAARIEHFILTILFCLFFLVHIIQVIFAGWNSSAAIIRGFEVIKENAEPIVADIKEINPIGAMPGENNPSAVAH